MTIPVRKDCRWEYAVRSGRQADFMRCAVRTGDIDGLWADGFLSCVTLYGKRRRGSQLRSDLCYIQFRHRMEGIIYNNCMDVEQCRETFEMIFDTLGQIPHFNVMMEKPI